MNSLAGSLTRRLSSGLAAQTYNQAVTIGAQLISVPILLTAWGAEQYGVWLLISAIPAYLSLAELGFAQVGASDMTMRLARGDRDSAQATYQTTFAVNCVAGIALFGLLTAFAFSPMISALIRAPQVDWTFRWALVALGAHALTSILRGVLAAGMRSIGKFSHAVALSATVRLFDLAVVLTVALAGGSILHAAIGMLATATILTLGGAVWLATTHRWLKLDMRKASRSSAKEMLHPSLNFLGYTVGNLITIQGSTIVIGAVLGPTAVAVATTVRTLARTGITAANMLSHTLQVEYSALYGRSDWHSLKRLLRRHCTATSILIALYALSMLAVGPWVYARWTHGELGAPTVLLGLMTFATVFEMAWTTLQTPAISVNTMRLTGRAYFIAGCISLFSLSLLLEPLGLEAFGFVTLALSALMTLLALWELRRVLGLSQFSGALAAPE